MIADAFWRSTRFPFYKKPLWGSESRLFSYALHYRNGRTNNEKRTILAFDASFHRFEGLRQLS